MEILYTTQLSVPLLQVVLLLALSTVVLLFGSMRVAILINYCFLLYWGYMGNSALFTEEGIFKFNSFTSSYLGFGLVIVILAVIGLFLHRD